MNRRTAEEMIIEFRSTDTEPTGEEAVEIYEATHENPLNAVAFEDLKGAGYSSLWDYLKDSV